MLAAEVFQRYFNVVVALWFQLFVFLAFVVVSALHLFDDVNHSFQLLILNIEFHDLLNFLKILLFTYCKRCSPLSMRRLILVSSRHGWEINWFKALKKFRRQLKMQKKKNINSISNGRFGLKFLHFLKIVQTVNVFRIHCTSPFCDPCEIFRRLNGKWQITLVSVIYLQWWNIFWIKRKFVTLLEAFCTENVITC